MFILMCLAGSGTPAILAARGTAYRGVYFAGVLVAGLAGVMAIELTGPALTGSTYQEQVGQRFINDYGPAFAALMFSLAFGCAIGACIYRPKNVTPLQPIN